MKDLNRMLIQLGQNSIICLIINTRLYQGNYNLHSGLHLKSLESSRTLHYCNRRDFTNSSRWKPCNFLVISFKTDVLSVKNHSTCPDKFYYDDNNSWDVDNYVSLNIQVFFRLVLLLG